MTIREHIEPTLRAERKSYEALEHSAETIESTISEHFPESLKENIKMVAAQLREAARPHREKHDEIRKALEQKHSPPPHGASGNQ
jgi:siroheme synthase (precorrin-2 oxidase/ferrochelatase)